MKQPRFKIGDVVYKTANIYRDDADMDPKPYVVVSIQMQIDEKETSISYNVLPPGYESCNYHDRSPEELTFATLQEGQAFVNTKKQQQLPPAGSKLEKKFRRRWVGGKYVDELIDP